MFILKRNKIIIILGLSLILSSSSYADSKANNFFLKSIVALSKPADAREKHNDMSSPLVQESTMTPSIGVGIGYYVDEDIRADLILEGLSWSFLDQQGNFNYNEPGGAVHIGSRTISRKASGTSLMLNGYIDIVEVNSCKIFLGAGGGIVQIKEKVNVTTIESVIDHGVPPMSIPSSTGNGSSKTATNVSYSLILGANIIINPQVNVELTYLWRNFGKLKYQQTGSFTRSSNNVYQGHYLSVGLRYDI
jgi:opacity protein-like surface antigen